MGMGIGSGGDKNPQPEVNVTPLVDVTLVVLIIFMVVTPLMTKTFWLNVPPENKEKTEVKEPDDDNKPLVMTIDKDGIIRVNQTKLMREEIGVRLPRMLAAKKQRVLYFDASDEIPYGTAVEVMDLARAGGARSIAILTEKVAP